MGVACSGSPVESEVEVIIYEPLNIPDSIIPKGFPLAEQDSESEYEYLPYLNLPSYSGGSSMKASPRAKIDSNEDDKLNLQTSDNTPPCIHKYKQRLNIY